MSDLYSRRELLHSLLGFGAGSILSACPSDAARPQRPIEGSLLGPDVDTGHRLRGAAFHELIEAQPERQQRVQVAVVGAGPAGLTAAWHLVNQGVRDVKVLDLEEAPGGTSRAGESAVTGYPWGAHYLPVPMPHHTELRSLLDSMGVLDGEDARGVPRGAETALIRDPEERLFVHGYWQPGLFPSVGASREDLTQFHRFRSLVDHYVGLRDGRGRRAFTIPLSNASDDASLVALERLSAASWLTQQGITSPRVRWFCEYACRDDYGQSLATTSAWALIFYYAARTYAPGEETMPRIAWPEGNGALVQHLMKPLRDCWIGRRLVVDVRPRVDQRSGRDNGVELRLWNPEDQTAELILADHAVVAVPRFVARKIVRPLREASSRAEESAFSYSPWLVANLHLRGRPVEWGSAPAWDNVLYDSPSLGYVSATHQSSRDRGPTVWSYYYPLTDADPADGRRRLLAADWDLWKDVILADLGRAHEDLARHTQRIDIWRWGHGMVQPRVGQVFSPARKRAREPIGSIHFAHSDLSGIGLFEEAFDHGLRAAREVLQALQRLPDKSLPEIG